MSVTTTVNENRQKAFELLTEVRELLVETVSEHTYGYDDLTDIEELENMITQIRKMKEKL